VIDIPAPEAAPLPPPAPSPAPPAEVEPEGEGQGMDDIFGQQSGEDLLSPRQVDDFWNNLVQDMNPSNEAFTDAFSYEQARRMGLTPDE
jgi:hypothetical protein